ncbi:MAG TPA: hypothetical protein VFC78_22450 [Tepidisphaeraceae bacterium]|nr:hypothetical protein [Tepidisphaeraceae bacterium]
MNPLGPFYSLDFVLLLACAVIYYKAAEMEDVPGLLWCGLSVGTFFVTWRLLRWGLPGEILGQVGLLGAITLFRVFRDRQKP